jgi:hypothetical protein
MEADCKYGDETSGSTKRGEFLDSLTVLNTLRNGTHTNDQHSVQELLQLDAKYVNLVRALNKTHYVNQFRITQCTTSTGPLSLRTATCVSVRTQQKEFKAAV